MNLKALMALRANKVVEMQSLLDTATAENRELTAEETVKYDALMAEQNSLKGQITRVEAQEKLNAELSQPTTKTVSTMGAPAIIKMADNQVLDETGFSSFGDFMGAVKTGRDSRLEFVAQTMGTGSEGGFLVPKQFGQMLTAFTPETSLVRPRATVVPAGDMPDAEIGFPALDQSGDKGVYSGVVTTWLAEGEEIDETAFSLRDIAMKSKAVAAYIPFSNKLLRNAPAASTLGSMLLRQALAKAEDDAFIKGDGVGKPMGFLNHASAKAVNRALANKVSFVDMANMVTVSKGDNKEWVISTTLYTQIVTMADGDGKYIFTVGINGAPDRILGYPIRWSERTPTVGVKGDVMLLDLGYYYIKDGSGIILSASEHVQFTKDKTLFKAIWNVDGQSSMNSTLKLENGATVSPFVILDIPAA